MPKSWLARAFLGLLGGVLSVSGTVVGAGWWLSMSGHQGPITDHFDGEVFLNREQTALPDAQKALQMATSYNPVAWDAWRENPPAPKPAQRVHDGLVVSFVNHATVLLQFDGLNVLTDPIWSERCSAVQWAGPQRHHAPGLSLDDLPPIDVILISHNHYDHLDVATLLELSKRGDPLVITGLGNAAFIEALGLRAMELDWDQTTTVGDLTVIGQRTRHFSSRGLFDRMKTLWLGFVLKGPSQTVYFGGDTAMGSHFAETGANHGPFDLALLPIGAYLPRWFMSPVHIDPKEAVLAHQQLGALRSVGIHHGTFQLSQEGQDEPAEQVALEASAAGLATDAFRTLAPGESWRIADEEAP